MKGRNIFKMKAISTSIFIVAIILMSSTVIPTIYGSKFSVLSEKEKNKEEVTYENIFSFLENKIFLKLSIYENIISKHNTRFIHNQFLKQGLDKTLISKGVMDVSEDFKIYWNHYKNIIKWWEKFDTNTMEEWFQELLEKRGELIGDNIEYAIIAIILGIITTLGGASNINWIPVFFMMSYALVKDVSLTWRVLWTYAEWFYLVGNSCNIVVYVTDQNGEGIDNLEGHIKANSTEAYNEIKINKTAPLSHMPYFVYPLDSDTGYSGSGWYSTSSWWNVYNQTAWDKPPCPPGYWNISIKDVEGYKNAFINKTEDLKKQKTSIINITLYSNPNIPTIITKDYALKVGEIGNFTIFAKDPDNDNVSYQCSWGDGNFSGWTPFAGSGGSVTLNHEWTTPGEYEVKAQTMDSHNNISPWRKGLTVYIID